jgi:hypothetical protein
MLQRSAFKPERKPLSPPGLTRAAVARFWPAMDRPDPDKPVPTPLANAKAEREARLAAALRENLRKRKAQARAREAAEKPDGTPPEG